MSRLHRLVTAVAIAALLAGCAKQGLRGDDTTGDLGSPVVAPSPADVYTELAAAYLSEGNSTEAYKNAQKAVIIDPRSSNAYFVLGVVQQRLGQSDAADKAYRKAVSLGPQNPAALNGYGSFLCDRGEYKEADSYFRRALANPLYETPWITLHNAGWCNEKAGQIGAAETDYRAALRVNQRFAPSLLGMARVSFGAENFLSSRAYLQRYAEVAPDTAESLWLGVRTERQLGDERQMASYGLKLRTQFPDSDEAKHLQTIE